jgi:hypothetical protein
MTEADTKPLVLQLGAAPDPATLSREQQVAEGYALDQLKSALDARLKLVKAQLAKLPAGDYRDEAGHIAQVIAPSPKIAPGTAQVAAVRGELDPKKFQKLFFHVKTWKPVEQFRAAAKALLTAKEYTRVIAVCEVPTTPYVVFK